MEDKTIISSNNSCNLNPSKSLIREDNVNFKECKINTNKFESKLLDNNSSSQLLMENNNVKQIVNNNQSKRRKCKEPGVINEYPASAIPNNIGDKSIEKLADYVNGGSVKKKSNKKSNLKNKIKIVSSTKKVENDKNNNNLNQETIHDSIKCESLLFNNVNNDHLTIEKNVINELKSIKTDGEIDIIEKIDNSEIEDDQFYQVVRYKNRNRTKLLKPQQLPENFDICSKNGIEMNFKFPTIKTTNNIIKTVLENDLHSNVNVLNIKDPPNLNEFIYHLWIEFQNKHDTYVREQKDEKRNLESN